MLRWSYDVEELRSQYKVTGKRRWMLLISSDSAALMLCSDTGTD